MDEVARITRAAGVVGFFTLLSRIFGLLRDIIIGYLFGARGVADAFFVAFRIPNLLRRLTAEGAFSAGFVPVFTDYLTNRTKEEALSVARVIFTFAALVLGALTVLGIIFASPLTYLFAPGFFADGEKFNLAVFLTRLMFPYVFFVSLVALAMGFLNSFRHFMAPALSPVLLNVSIIVCALMITPFLSQPVVSLGYGVLLGGVIQLALQIPFLSRETPSSPHGTRRNWCRSLPGQCPGEHDPGLHACRGECVLPLLCGSVAPVPPWDFRHCPGNRRLTQFFLFGGQEGFRGTAGGALLFASAGEFYHSPRNVRSNGPIGSGICALISEGGV
jgi:hypothetical protein